MGTYEGSTHFDGYKPLSRKERRALTMAVIVGVIYVANRTVVHLFFLWHFTRSKP